jgi:hypothetical protein
MVMRGLEAASSTTESSSSSRRTSSAEASAASVPTESTTTSGRTSSTTREAASSVDGRDERIKSELVKVNDNNPFTSLLKSNTNPLGAPLPPPKPPRLYEKGWRIEQKHCRGRFVSRSIRTLEEKSKNLFCELTLWERLFHRELIHLFHLA